MKHVQRIDPVLNSVLNLYWTAYWTGLCIDTVRAILHRNYGTVDGIVRASKWRCLRNDSVDRPDSQGDRPPWLLCKPTVKCFLAVKSWDQGQNPGQNTKFLLFYFLSFSFHYYINRLFIQIILMQHFEMKRIEPKWPFWGQKPFFGLIAIFGPCRPPYRHAPSGQSLFSEMTVWHHHLRRPPSDRILTDRTVNRHCTALILNLC
jgi:hypothetical protein